MGKKGGLCLIWDDSVDVSLLSYSTFHIDVEVLSQRGSPWRFTSFYGNPDLAQCLHGMSSHPWLCAGNFNEILEDFEKMGGLKVSGVDG